MKLLLIAFLAFNTFCASSQVIKFAGAGLAIGSGISPSGNLGVFGVAGLLPNTGLILGVAINPGKAQAGIVHQFNLGKRFSLEPFVVYQRLISYSTAFDEDTDPRFYNYSSADLISPGASFKYCFRNKEENGSTERSWVFLKLGYSQRLTDYSIQQESGTFRQSDRDKMYHAYYGSNFFWNIGVEFRVGLRKRTKTD